MKRCLSSSTMNRGHVELRCSFDTLVLVRMRSGKGSVLNAANLRPI